MKAPGFGDRRKAMLGDIAVLTGGQFISEDLGIKLENITPDMFGQVKRAVVTKDNNTLVEGGGTQDAVMGRIGQIKAQIDATDSNYDREKLQERLAKLAGGVAVLKVGAATETELKEKKHRFEDALSATRAAVEEGIVPGGGATLAKIAPQLADLAKDSKDNEARVGIDIVRRALEEPLRQIASNAGLEGSVATEKVRTLARRPEPEAATGDCGRLITAMRPALLNASPTIV